MTGGVDGASGSPRRRASGYAGGAGCCHQPHPRSGRAAAGASAPAASASGGYLVQVSSQAEEADAQASFRACRASSRVLGSREPVIKRADLGEKAVYYRAMVGPFGASDEATAVRAA